MKKTLLHSLLITAAFVAAPTFAAPNAPTANNPDLRLAIDKVMLYAETNKIDQAFKLLDQLKDQYPDNSQVLQAEADLNLRIGNRGQAFATLNKARTVDPGNEGILERQRSAMLAQGPFVSGGYTFRRTSTAYENFASAAGQATLSPSVSASANFDTDWLHSRGGVTEANGITSNFSGTRERGGVTFNKAYGSGDEANFSVYGADNTIGAGAQYTFSDRMGGTTLQGNIHKPDWDYVEMVIQNGTKDNFRLERKQIITNHLQATLGGGYNNYNMDHDENVAGAGAWDFNLAYTHPYSFSGKPGDDIMLGAYYTVDAEYFTNRETRTNAAGNFHPLPASSYEIHSVNLSASKSITQQVYLEGFGGYGFDRLGSAGPLFGGALEYAPIEHLGIELRGSRTMLGGQTNSDKEDRLGLNLKWRW